MTPIEYKNNISLIKNEFENLLRKRSYSPFKIYPAKHIPPQQYWRVSATQYYDIDSLDRVDVVLFNISRQDLINPSISEFFHNNDHLLEEFDILFETGEFAKLSKILSGISDNKEDNEIIINIDAKFSSDNKFLSGLLQEFVCIISISEGRLSIDTMQNERKKIILQSDDGKIVHIVPYDKIELFSNLKNVNETAESNIDKNYFFVLMSFENDPTLLDAYEGIIRGVHDWNPEVTVERVDNIEEDFKISEKIIECINRAHVIIADLTYERPNVYYELGYARAKGKKIIHTAKKGTKIHFDIQDYKTIFWERSGTLEKQITKRVTSMLKNPNIIK